MYQTGSFYLVILNLYLLRCRSIWEVTCPVNCSWSWWKILGLHSLTCQFICNHVGDGRSTSLQFGNWHHVGLGRDMRLSCVIAGQERIWPLIRSLKWIKIIQCSPISFHSNDRCELCAGMFGMLFVPFTTKWSGGNLYEINMLYHISLSSIACYS